MISSSRVSSNSDHGPSGGADHPQLAAPARTRLSAPTITPRPDRVDEVDPGEVEHHAGRAPAHQAHDLLAQPGRGGQLELAGHGHDLPAVALGGHVEGEQHDEPPR